MSPIELSWTAKKAKKSADTPNTLKHGKQFLTLFSTPPLPPATIRWQKVPPSEESRARRVRFALPEQNLGERPHNAAMDGSAPQLDGKKAPTWFPHQHPEI